VVLGVSVDALDDEQKFTDKEKLTFPILADADKTASAAYGVLNDKGGYANRTTFVIDKKGVVRKIYTKVDVNTHPQEVLDYVKENLAEKK
jgi:peroxiredoxin Q/BCP